MMHSSPSRLSMPVLKADTDTSSSSQKSDMPKGTSVGAMKSARIVAMSLTVLENYSVWCSCGREVLWNFEIMGSSVEGVELRWTRGGGEVRMDRLVATW
jgi:hypothetical protein